MTMNEIDTLLEKVALTLKDALDDEQHYLIGALSVDTFAMFLLDTDEEDRTMRDKVEAVFASLQDACDLPKWSDATHPIEAQADRDAQALVTERHDTAWKAMMALVDAVEAVRLLHK